MHQIQDEQGNPVPHEHEHTHTHTHTYEHEHPHTHEHGHEEDHDHQHGEAAHTHCGACEAHEQESLQGDKKVALLDYMWKHNEHHAAELDQVADQFCADGRVDVAEQIRKAADEFQKGNLYLKLALSMVQENQ